MQRSGKKQKVIAIFNFSEQAQNYDLKLEGVKHLKLLEIPLAFCAKWLYNELKL